LIETLFGLDLPAGFQNTGTVYQSKGRWHKGNLVRFFEKTIQPVGGWVQRTLTGATISGVPNDALSWQLNDGNAYLAIGTSTGLYIVTSANVVHDITPATVAGDGLTHLWQLETFGAYLIATFQRPIYLDTAVINTFVWRGVLATPAIAAYDSNTGPGSAFGVTVTPERFLVILRGADPAAWAPDGGDGGGGTSGGEGGVDGGGGAPVGGGGGVAPTETPGVPTLSIVSTVGTVVYRSTWTNTNSVASIRHAWEISTAGASGPFSDDGTRELSPESTTITSAHSTGAWVRARVQYFNATGAGPWSSYSSVLAI
jgi:hypothetical protein